MMSRACYLALILFSLMTMRVLAAGAQVKKSVTGALIQTMSVAQYSKSVLSELKTKTPSCKITALIDL